MDKSKPICKYCKGNKFSPLYSYRPVLYKGEMWCLGEVRCLECDKMIQYLFQVQYKEDNKRLFIFDIEEIKLL